MKKYFYVLLFVAGGICMASCNKDDDNPSPKSDAKQILSFVFKEEDNTALNEDVTAEINQEDKTITATVPFGTELTSLLPEVEVSEKAAVSPTGAQDFSNEVTYTVTAENGTKATYKVIVNQAEPNASNAKQILSFVFKEEDNTALNEDVTAAINQEDKTIAATVPFGTELTSLLPEVKVSEKAAVSPTGAQDFSNEVTYTVTAENGTKATYKVIVNQADPNASDAKQILSFVFKEEDNTALNEDVTAEINQEEKTITATFPFNTDVTSLLPLIEVSEKATVSPAGAQDFTNEVIFTVTAQDQTQEHYTFKFNFTAPTQREVLIAIYNSNPGNTLGWDINNEDISSWVGVTVDDQGRVIKLVFVDEDAQIGYGLVTLPAEIGQLTSLETLSLYSNQLTSIPAEIGQLTSLETLSLNNNQLTSIPAEIGQLTSLGYLYLDYNQLTSIPAEIGQLTSLEYLSLGNNQLTSIPAEIGQLTSLETLSLYNNQLTSIPTEIGQLTKLKYFYLYENELRSIPAEIGQLTNLEYLFLYNNQLTSIPTEIGQLTKLKYFYLYENELTSIPAEIGQLTKLKYLYLNNNPLTSIPSGVCNLENNGTNIIKDDGVTCETAADD
ncbi:leucine-rich repeat domain-containing protein [Abyssalbus ytuae]|uniref:Leucine-rich repeat domain-containing protein n=1 Tax=Abyssalbus ytuae TaxID=2926907 RepID=A0A9E6ZRH2_9FLAO|nr:leucine-rich repeat domain-containing protein [Abyssalbus ytuae]UOB19145.1 leucine-rich repeat domain-containing protein [Abyssalbus ytuae]